jgi:hypothetical protein
MLRMLPADPQRHRDGVEAMVAARVAWLRERGLGAPSGMLGELRAYLARLIRLLDSEDGDETTGP